jgi:hypothetical protein
MCAHLHHPWVNCLMQDEWVVAVKDLGRGLQNKFMKPWGKRCQFAHMFVKENHVSLGCNWRQATESEEISKKKIRQTSTQIYKTNHMSDFAMLMSIKFTLKAILSRTKSMTLHWKWKLSLNIPMVGCKRSSSNITVSLTDNGEAAQMWHKNLAPILEHAMEERSTRTG